MVDAVTSQTILDGDRLAIFKFTNISDGTGEAAVTKIDVSTLAPDQYNKPCTGCKINKVWALTQGMSVRILWDATTDVPCIIVPENQMYKMCFDEFGGLSNNAGAGKNGDVLFTTGGAASGDTYTIVLEVIKTYG